MKKYYTLNYLINRLKLALSQKLHPNDPWLTRESVILLNHLIKKSDIGFEFGSGRSTKWFASRCKFLYSIEHNKVWYDIVRSQIKDLKNVEYCFREISINKPDESEYLSDLKKVKNQSLDFILNDGKIRELVASISLDKLKSGGIYIVDNAERYIVNSFKIPESIGLEETKMLEKWNIFYQTTKEWRRIWTTYGVTSTLIMFKP